MRIVGIDPGKNGGLVTLSKETGLILDKMTMSENFDDQANYIAETWECDDSRIFVFIEKAQAMPKNGCVSMFNYGVGFGQLLGILMTLKIPHALIPPKIWTKVMHIGGSGKNPKEKSREVARRLFPGESFLDPSSKKAKKPHEGLIDACLIAEYGRRVLTRQI